MPLLLSCRWSRGSRTPTAEFALSLFSLFLKTKETKKFIWEKDIPNICSGASKAPFCLTFHLKSCTRPYILGPLLWLSRQKCSTMIDPTVVDSKWKDLQRCSFQTVLVRLVLYTTMGMFTERKPLKPPVFTRTLWLDSTIEDGCLSCFLGDGPLRLR